MKTAFIIIWVVGIVVALLGERRLREYKDYDKPTAYLVTGIDCHDAFLLERTVDEYLCTYGHVC